MDYGDIREVAKLAVQLLNKQHKLNICLLFAGNSPTHNDMYQIKLDDIPMDYAGGQWNKYKNQNHPAITDFAVYVDKDGLTTRATMLPIDANAKITGKDLPVYKKAVLRVAGAILNGRRRGARTLYNQYTDLELYDFDPGDAYDNE